VPSGSADIWVSWYWSNTNGFGFTNTIFLLEDASNTSVFRTYSNGGTHYLQYHNGSSWTTLYSEGSLSSRRYDLRLFNDPTAGVIEVYKNGSSVASFTGDTTFSGAVDVPTQATFHYGGASNSNSENYVSSWFVADEDSRNITMIRTTPQSYGVNLEWTGSYTDVDELGADDADYIAAFDANKRVTYGVGTVTSDFDVGYDVVGVGVSCRAYKGQDISQNLELMVQSGSSEALSDTKTLDLTKQPQQHVFATDPDTAAAWTVAAAKVAEIGVKTAS